MTEKRFELRLCNNGNYYLYCNGILINNPYIHFDKFHKEDAESIINELNYLSEEIEWLKKENKTLSNALTAYFESKTIKPNYDAR